MYINICRLQFIQLIMYFKMIQVPQMPGLYLNVQDLKRFDSGF